MFFLDSKKEFEVNGKKVVVIREGDKFYALGGICVHHGAPLAKGKLITPSFIANQSEVLTN